MSNNHAPRHTHAMKEAERRAAMHGNDAHSIFATAKDIMVEVCIFSLVSIEPIGF
jgi:hypothetical protein